MMNLQLNIRFEGDKQYCPANIISKCKYTHRKIMVS